MELHRLGEHYSAGPQARALGGLTRQPSVQEAVPDSRDMIAPAARGKYHLRLDHTPPITVLVPFLSLAFPFSSLFFKLYSWT